MQIQRSISSSQKRAALAVLTGGGASDYGGAGVLDRPREGEEHYQVRRRLLKLVVVLACGGALGDGL